MRGPLREPRMPRKPRHLLHADRLPVMGRGGSEMNPKHFSRGTASGLAARARLRTCAVVVALSSSIACGSSAGTSVADGSGGSTASGGAVDHASGGASAHGGALDHNAGGSAGTNVGAAGHDPGGGGASGGSVGTAGSGGTAGGGGTGGAGAGGASGGSAGGAPAPACPATPPTAASACASNGRACFYEDCAGTGRTAATCSNGSWAVQTGACAAVHCIGLPGSMSCASGQVCSVSESGTISGMCVQSTCGKGPITCACANASCASCSVAGNVQQGVTVTCNNCPQGGCA